MAHLVLGRHPPDPPESVGQVPLPAAPADARGSPTSDGEHDAGRSVGGPGARLLRYVAAWFGPDEGHLLTRDELEAWRLLSGCGL
jgi:hypothetical protein